MRGMGRSILIFYIFIFSTSTAHAYLDPGTGSMVLQVVLGGIAGIAILGKLFWNRFKELFKFNKTASRTVIQSSRKSISQQFDLLSARPTAQSDSQSVRSYIIQSIGPYFAQPVRHTINQSVIRPMQSASEPINQSVGQSFAQWANRWASQAHFQLLNHSVTQSLSH